MIIIINSNSTKNDRKTTDARQRRGVGPSRYRLDLVRGGPIVPCFEHVRAGGGGGGGGSVTIGQVL